MGCGPEREDAGLRDHDGGFPPPQRREVHPRSFEQRRGNHHNRVAAGTTHGYSTWQGLGRFAAQSSRLPMVRLTIVPVIPLALSEAMKTAMLASSASVESRRVWVLLALNSWNCSQVIPDALA